MDVVRICIGLGVCLTIALGAGQNIAIHAIDDVPIFELRDDALVPSSSALKAGSTTFVSSCVDLKHYIAPKVEADGQPRIVRGGDYRVERKSFIGSWKLPIVYSC